MSGSGERRTSCHFDLIGESWRIGLKLAEWNRLVDETDFDRLPGGDRPAGHASGIKFQAVDDGTGTAQPDVKSFGLCQTSRQIHEPERWQPHIRAQGVPI